MDTAKDRSSGRSWMATEYARAGVDDRPAELACTGQLNDGTRCEADAYFVRRSRDGREEHFAARHRGADCDEGSHSSTSAAGDAGHQVPALAAVTNGELRILTDSPPLSAWLDRRRRPDEREPGTLTRRYSPALGTQPRPATTERRLRGILAMLVADPPLISPQVIVRVKGFKATRAARFFAPLHALTAADARREGGFYGVIARIYVDDDQALRIYVRGPAGTKPATVLLRAPAVLAAGLQSRSARDAITGHYVLVLGTCHGGQSRPYVPVENRAHFVTAPPATSKGATARL